MNDIFKMAEQAYHALSIAESELKRLYKENAELKNSLKQSEQGVIMKEIITDGELINIAKDKQAYLNTFADGPVIRFGRAVEAIVSHRYDELMFELERENHMIRARNERLEREVKWLETIQQQTQAALLNKS